MCVFIVVSELSWGYDQAQRSVFTTDLAEDSAIYSSYQILVKVKPLPLPEALHKGYPSLQLPQRGDLVQVSLQ